MAQGLPVKREILQLIPGIKKKKKGKSEKGWREGEKKKEAKYLSILSILLYFEVSTCFLSFHDGMICMF